MPRRSGKCGVRLASVLVVVAGLVVLFTLAPLAIQSSRESARRNPCSNNLRRIAIALASYHQAHGMFPMGAMHAGPNPGGDPPITAGLGPSWWFGIMPFSDVRNDLSWETTKQYPGSRWPDREDIYDGISATQALNGPAKHDFCAADMIAAQVPVDRWGPEWSRCPASSLPRSEQYLGPIDLPSYVAVAGGCDIDPESPDYRFNDRTGFGPPAPRSTKIYHNTHKGTGAAVGGIVASSGMLPPCQHVKLGDCSDGKSNTMMVAEQSDWLRDRDPLSTGEYIGSPGWTSCRGPGDRLVGTASGGGWLSGTRRVDPVPKAETPGGPPADWGADCWNITTVRYPPNYKRVMGTTPLPGCSENHGINNPLQSPHPGGLQAAMADGSVRFISEKTALEVLLRLAIRDDGGQAQTP